MPRYITFFSYTRESAKAMMERPSDRTAAARALVESVGGQMEAFYWMHGKHDGFIIASYPDGATSRRAGNRCSEHRRHSPGRDTRDLRPRRADADRECGQGRCRCLQAANRVSSVRRAPETRHGARLRASSFGQRRELDAHVQNSGQT